MRYALQRLGQFILVFLVVTFLVMVITRVGSKDPARDLAGGLVAQEQVDELTKQVHASTVTTDQCDAI